MNRRRIPFVASLALAALCSALPAQELPGPEEFLGQRIGADGFLADYAQLEAWWKLLDERSPRLALEDMGRTSYGLTQWLAVVTAPSNHLRLEELRGISERLSLGRDEGEEIAQKLAKSGRVVVWIDGGLHANESIAAQNILELVWQMVSREDAEVARILENVILLVCPANPDGMQLISRGYRATGRVGQIPVLYQKYLGHDNNRDFYAGNMPETRNILRAHYHRWFPRIIYNHHQTAPRGTVIYTPPFRDPFNYNVDPLVVRGIEIVAAHMNHRFAAEGKPGVISRSGATYSTWWNGGLRTASYFHNAIGILTEVYGTPDPSRISPSLDQRVPHGDYPDPILGQPWHARQTIDYLQTANFAILDYASRYGEELLYQGWQLARRAIERGSKDYWTATPELLAIAKERDEASRAKNGENEPEVEPNTIVPAFQDPSLRDARVYVIPADQPDFASATRLVRALRRNAIEIGVAREAIALPARGKPAPAGSYVIQAAQAYRPHLRDMLEPQWHPDDLGKGGEPIRPYDSAGWTLSMQHDVEVVKVLEPLVVATHPLLEVEAPFRAQLASAGEAGWVLDARSASAVIAVNRLRAAGVAVARVPRALEVGGEALPPGAFFVPALAGAERASALASELGVAFHGVDAAPPEAQPLRAQRLGVFDVWGGSMTAGWTQWVMEQAEFPYTRVTGQRIAAGNLAQDFDTLVFHDGLPASRDARESRERRDSLSDEDIADLQELLPPFEDWSDLAARRVALTAENTIEPLRAFLAAGGTIVALGDDATKLARLLDLPVQEGLKKRDANGNEKSVPSSEFFIPGSLLWARAQPAHPLSYGCSERFALMFRRSPVFTSDDPKAELFVTYPSAGRLLASGWEIGAELLRDKAAALRLPVGEGSVVLFGADVIYRGQPWGTMKLLFNALLPTAQ
ncbi:MAG: peptidase [Planctomycetes bacterium]|nr:peptidase [Planctomycetota bacterium]